MVRDDRSAADDEEPGAASDGERGRTDEERGAIDDERGSASGGDPSEPDEPPEPSGPDEPSEPPERDPDAFEPGGGWHDEPPEGWDDEAERDVFGPSPGEREVPVEPGSPRAINVLFVLLGALLALAIMADLVGLL